MRSNSSAAPRPALSAISACAPPLGASTYLPLACARRLTLPSALSIRSNLSQLACGAGTVVDHDMGAVGRAAVLRRKAFAAVVDGDRVVGLPRPLLVATVRGDGDLGLGAVGCAVRSSGCRGR